MLRKRVVIKKDDIKEWVSNDKISKIEISGSKNKGLKDPDALSVNVYYKMTKQQWRTVCDMLKRCSVFASENSDKLMAGKLAGIASDSISGFIKETHVKLIIEAQKEYNFNFCIPRWLRTFPN